jgi:hypothetical protein
MAILPQSVALSIPVDEVEWLSYKDPSMNGSPLISHYHPVPFSRTYVAVEQCSVSPLELLQSEASGKVSQALPEVKKCSQKCSLTHTFLIVVALSMGKLTAPDKYTLPCEFTSVLLSACVRTNGEIMNCLRFERGSTVCGKLELQDAEDRERPFYRDLQENDLIAIRKVIERLVDWKRWNDPADNEIDQVISDNKSRLKNWFKDHSLTTGYLGGAGE